MADFKLCYNEACYKDMPDLKADIITAERAGFDFIEMRFDCVRSFMEAGGDLAEIGALFKKLKIKPATQNALYLYPGCLEPGDCGERREGFEHDLELLQQLHEGAGVSSVIVVAPLLKSADETTGYEREFVLGDCTRSLEALCSRMPWCEFVFEPVGLKRSLVRNLDDAAQIVRKVHSGHCSLVLDSCNLFLEHLESNYDFSGLDKREIGAVHLMNGINPGCEITEQSFRRLCGDGDWVDTARFVRELSKTGYRGFVSAEVFNRKYEQDYTRDELIVQACNSLKLAIA